MFDGFLIFAQSSTVHHIILMLMFLWAWSIHEQEEGEEKEKEEVEEGDNEKTILYNFAIKIN